MASQADQAKGLFASLFDFNFTSFITLKFLKVIYIILMGIIGLSAIIMFFAFLVTGKAAGVLVAIFIVPIGAFLYLLIVRVYLESLALFFRIGENTQAIRQSLGGPPASMPGAPGGFGGGYPTPPPQPQGPPPGPGVGTWQTPPQPQPPVQPPQPPQQPPAGGGWGAPPQQPPQPPQAPPGQTGFPPPGGQ